MMLAKEWLRKLLKKSPIKHLWYYRYDYNFTPSDLCYLVRTITEASNARGIFLEIGCAYGATTVFLNKHMSYSGIERTYICIDTFAGFTEQDIDHEIKDRGKSREMFSGAFLENSKQRFDEAVKFNRIDSVVSYEADINSFDIKSLGEIAFCLFDVDLYRPIASALPALFQQLAPGGVIIVDDCKPNNRFDGAWEAYLEFCEKNQLPVEVVNEKLGILRKSR